MRTPRRVDPHIPAIVQSYHGEAVSVLRREHVDARGHKWRLLQFHCTQHYRWLRVAVLWFPADERHSMTFTREMIRIEGQQLIAGCKREISFLTGCHGIGQETPQMTPKCMKGNGGGYPGRLGLLGDLSGERGILDKSPPC